MSQGPPATSGNELAPQANPGGPERKQLIAELQREFSTRGLRRRRRTRLVRQISVQTLLQTGGPLKRALDVLLALLVLPFAIPVLVALYLVALFYGGGIVRRTKLGRSATTFGQYTYDWGDMPAGASLRTSVVHWATPPRPA